VRREQGRGDLVSFVGCGRGGFVSKRQGGRRVRLYEGWERALRYIVTKEDDQIFVYETWGGVVNADGEEKVLTAFFRAPSPISSVGCAGDKVAVGCQSGAVLTFHAA
jgi:hypothetical protein